jgi:biopolymer transport protein ExbD
MKADSGGDEDGINAINVTPLVDITFVLLIVFMVTAKLIASKSVPLDLPKAATGAELQTIFSVTLTADGHTLVNSGAIANDDAITQVAAAANKKENDLRAVIQADAAVPHGRVIHVLDLLKQAGIAKVAFAVVPAPPASAPVP